MIHLFGKKLWLFGAVSASLTVAVLVEWWWPSLIAETLIPPLGAALSLWSGRQLYFWQREVSHARRKARRVAAPAEPVDVIPPVRNAETYEGIGPIHSNQWRLLHEAAHYQGIYFANGILSALLPSLALLLLSLQILVFSRGGGWALGLIVAEALCLFLLVNFAWSHPEPTAEWTEARARTELLRREQYLIVAGCGPYLRKTPEESAQEAMIRLGLIKGASGQELIRLMLLQDSARGNWLEALYKSDVTSLEYRPDLTDRIGTYLYRRVVKQLQWFANEIRDCRENERIWNRSLKTAVLAAFLVAVVHGLHLLSSLGSADSTHPWGIATTALGIFLPPLGTTLLGIKSMYSFDHRCRLYQRTEGLLHEYRGVMESLLAEAANPSRRDGDRSIEEIDLDFRAAALRVEQALSFELEQWHLLMDRTEHHVTS